MLHRRCQHYRCLSPTKSEECKRDPEIHQARKNSQYLFGMRVMLAQTSRPVWLACPWYRRSCGRCHTGCRTSAWRRKRGVCRRWIHRCRKTGEHENFEMFRQIAARSSAYFKFNKRSLLYKTKREIEYCKAQARARSSNRLE